MGPELSGRGLRIVPDEILHSADGVIVRLHGVLELFKQIDVSSDQQYRSQALTTLAVHIQIVLARLVGKQQQQQQPRSIRLGKTTTKKKSLGIQCGYYFIITLLATAGHSILYFL